MILLIDNYDSFTFNVYQYLCQLGQKVKVVRNDKITIKGIEKARPEAIVISPGPGNPNEAGITLEAINSFAGEIPILGICLGHQSIGQAFGGKIVRARTMMHGKVSLINHSGRGLYRGLTNPLSVTRYHSLIIDRPTLPKCFRITAETEDGIIMGIKHKRYPIEGIQFHPESYRTERGIEILENFCNQI